MSHITYALQYNGETVATIADADYATPEFFGTAAFLDPHLLTQLNKIQEFGIWSEDALLDNVSDEDYYKAMERRGVEPKYYDMWHSGKWTICGSDGSVSRSIVTIDGDVLVWRPE